MWQILVATETRVSTLREPEIEEVLRDFEIRGLESVSSRGAHLCTATRMLGASRG
jgi:hypothetical protein